MRTVSIGVIGCGVISKTYFRDMTSYYGKWLRIAAVADLNMEAARCAAEEFGIPRACTTEELLADPEIEIVVNLTIPAVHAEVDRQILNAGKHVYSEKPLAMSMEEADEILRLAEQRKLMICCAPEPFLNGGQQTARKALDDGKIGRPILVTANMVKNGPETWHPNPDFYYRAGGGPMLDMAPYYLTALVALLGPIAKVSCFSVRSSEQRMIYSQPRKGEMMPVSVDTTFVGLLEFASGVLANLTMSFDVWRSDLPNIQIYGSDGTLRVTDPDLTRGVTSLYRKENITEHLDQEIYFGNRYADQQQELYEELPMVIPEPEEFMRGLGVLDMAFALVNGRQPRASAALSYHVTEVMYALMRSAEENKPQQIHSSCERPAPVQPGEFV